MLDVIAHGLTEALKKHQVTLSAPCVCWVPIYYVDDTVIMTPVIKATDVKKQKLTMDKAIIINLFGQESYSRSRRATSYDAVDIAWKQIGAIWADDRIHVPHSMGCGLGGGIWSIYSAIVDAHHPDVVAVWLADGPNSQPAVV